MILVIADLRFVLMEDCLPFLIQNASQSVKDTYDRWTKANDKACIYILASMSDILSKKHEIMVIARQIMDSFREIFGQPSIQIKQEAIKYVYNARMKKDQSVKENVLDMIVKFNVAEMNGVVFDEKSQVSYILKSLSKSFLQFRCNTEMNKIEYNMTTLLKELQTFQSLKGRKEGEANVVHSRSSFKQFEEDEMTLKVETGDVISARAMEDAKLGYINLDRIGRLVNNGLLNEFEDDSLLPCESCLEGKMTKRPFTGKGYKAKEPLELIHSDLCDPMNHKSEALEKFKEYKAEVENILSKKIKILRSDRGGEYMDLRFQNYMIEHGIKSQLSAPGLLMKLVPHQELMKSPHQVVIEDDGVEDPLSYKQAMNDVDKDQWVKGMDLEMESSFDQNVDEPCVYKKINKGKATFLVLYVDDILLIGNDVGYLTIVKTWLAAQFQMKDLGEAQYVLDIQIIRDRKNKMLARSQATYIDKMLVRYLMHNSKKSLLPFRHGVHLSKK
ncbi:hypothetical protein E5676_scaffold519G00200 [Cucumis melo var. makuwa]|uniref:Reverse transcriptase Ty1/copia-type domain-containing protein n=1 Tax=Cucumis melo var. makuwa TaxID=1194695 RepID=A0A5A7UJZ3_CUCMM|nr:hypothetical protein E6C27_scaffold24G003420 [Cucumis melo var. makuwa]TYK20395.1 hypothetical protein E5676_scaffold519G00200 [Cucumis melo var. makuwa]